MKLLLYSHYWAPTIGGVQSVAKQLADGLAGRRIGDAPDGEVAEMVDVTVVTQTPRGDVDDSKLPYRLVRSPGLFQLVSLLRHADLVHLAGPGLLPLAICWLIRKPTVVEHHDYNSICPNGLLFYEPTQTVCPGYFMARQYSKCIRCNAEKNGFLQSVRALALTFPRRWLSRRATRNIAVSKHVLNRIQLPRASVVYHGISERPAILETSSAANSAMRFAYVGRLVSIKGLDLIIEAADDLHKRGASFQVDIIGDGPERTRLEQLVAKLGLREVISFRGFLRGADLEKTVSGASVTLMPSICEETAGLAAIEQMARGKPSIVADIGGLPEVVADTGLKFTPGDSRALVDRMSQFLANPELVSKLGTAARKRAGELFSEGEMIEGHVEIYRAARRSSNSGK